MKENEEKFKKYKNSRIFEDKKSGYLWKYIFSDSPGFGHVSAYRQDCSLKLNEEKHGQLKQMIMDYKLGHIELYGGWKENYIAVNEESLVIPGINEKILIDLGKKFGQTSVIFKDRDRFQELSSNPRDGFGVIIKDFNRNNAFEYPDFLSGLRKGLSENKSESKKITDKFLFEVVGLGAFSYYRIKYGENDLIRLI